MMEGVVELKFEIVIHAHETQVDLKQWPDFMLILVLID